MRVSMSDTASATVTPSNRYTTQAAATDSFVFQHPDLVVVAPAGNAGDAHTRTARAAAEVACPGTCDIYVYVHCIYM